MNEPTLVQVMVIEQDIGSFEPEYRKAQLSLWSDRSVTWDWIAEPSNRIPS